MISDPEQWLPLSGDSELEMLYRSEQLFSCQALKKPSKISVSRQVYIYTDGKADAA